MRTLSCLIIMGMLSLAFGGIEPSQIGTVGLFGGVDRIVSVGSSDVVSIHKTVDDTIELKRIDKDGNVVVSVVSDLWSGTKKTWTTGEVFGVDGKVVVTGMMDWVSFRDTLYFVIYDGVTLAKLSEQKIGMNKRRIQSTSDSRIYSVVSSAEDNGAYLYAVGQMACVQDSIVSGIVFRARVS